MNLWLFINHTDMFWSPSATIFNHKCICWFVFIKLALMHGMEHVKY
jgi:hypothetical protein